MSNSIDHNAEIILDFLAKLPRDNSGTAQVNGDRIAGATNLDSNQINDAVTILEEGGLVEWRQWIGTGTYVFGTVGITPRGRFEVERFKPRLPSNGIELGATNSTIEFTRSLHPLTPAGSPYGFNEEDWEILSERKSSADKIRVVMGYQFQSNQYDASQLVENVEKMFKLAWEEYQREPGALPGEILFEPLKAGYGEHLFNEIVRDIISADIAVFDTSDLNPNVMIEMGVALTWGVRVLPIKESKSQKPPSDISGQTWADYENSGKLFFDSEHVRKLLQMVKRARIKKGRGSKPSD